MNRIFISYRREDTLVYADRLQEDIAGHFGPDEVFRDMDAIEPGSDFVAAIDGALSETEVMLVVIGPKWLGPEGRRRLHEAGDYVRAEVAAGLRSPRVRVIPVLVGGARMPAGEELPGDISSLTRRNAFEMIDTRWRADRSELFRRLDAMLAEDEAARTTRPAKAPGPGRRETGDEACARRRSWWRSSSPSQRSGFSSRSSSGIQARARRRRPSRGRARRRLRTHRRRACSSGSSRTPRASAGRMTSR